MRFLRVFLFFECFNWGLWGFNYSKMANYRFLIDSTTFWMDLGTSNFSTFFGPVVDPWTPYLSWIYFKTTTKMWEHPWKIWIWDIWESENLKNFGSPVYLTFWFSKFEIWRFEISKLEDSKIWRSEILIIRNDEFLKNMKSRRRGISWHYFCRRNFLKSLDMNLVSIKKHETIL